jgi:hypothetical protein
MLLKKATRLTVPAGGSPTGTGESPVPPILKKRPGNSFGKIRAQV